MKTVKTAIKLKQKANNGLTIATQHECKQTASCGRTPKNSIIFFKMTNTIQGGVTRNENYLTQQCMKKNVKASTHERRCSNTFQ